MGDQTEPAAFYDAVKRAYDLQCPPVRSHFGKGGFGKGAVCAHRWWASVLGGILERHADLASVASPAGRKPIGYMVAMKYPDNGHANAGTWQADWDGEIHPTVEAAFLVCLEANGAEWAADVIEYGLQPDTLRGADYLPYALTLALPPAK